MGALLLAMAAVTMGQQSCSDFAEEEPRVERRGGGEGSGETAQVGDKLTLQGTSYEVTNVDTASEVGDRLTGAKANGEFVIVELELTNEENEPATILEDNIRLIGGNGSEFTVDLISPAECPLS